MKRTLITLFSLALATSVVACSDDDDDNGGNDVGMTDTGMDDTGMDDTGMDDVGMDDVSMGDVGMDVATDAGGPDPRGPDNPPALTGTQIDRVGRPAISTALVGTFLPEDDANMLKDAYNAAGAGAWSGFSDDISASLGIIDALDATCGNQLLADDANMDGRYAALAGILADDQLYVHAERGSCGVYLGLEAEVVGAVESGDGGCGGRIPSDDVIERSYSVLAAGMLAGVDDTITENDVAFLAIFPYLAPAN